MRFKPHSPIQKCAQRKALGTTELPRGAFMQPQMHLDPPLSVFHSKPKYNLGPHGRRLKKLAKVNALKAPFAHPKVRPKEGFGYKWTPKGSLFAAPHATGPSLFPLSPQA